MNRRTVIIGAVALTAAITVPGVTRAGAVVLFDSRDFRAAQEAGTGIVLFVHAPW